MEVAGLERDVEQVRALIVCWMEIPTACSEVDKFSTNTKKPHSLLWLGFLFIRGEKYTEALRCLERYDAIFEGVKSLLDRVYEVAPELRPLTEGTH